MYKQSIDRIYRNGLMVDPVTTVRGAVTMALASVRQPFYRLLDDLEDWDMNGTNAPSMWGHKREGWLFIEENAFLLAPQLVDMRAEGNRHEAIDLLLTVPGLNVVKAGFVAQMLGFKTACIDVHNARMYDVTVESFEVRSRNTARTKLAKIEAYLKLCDVLGGETLWNRWCELIAEQQSKHFSSPEQVSAVHEKGVLRNIVLPQ